MATPNTRGSARILYSFTTTTDYADTALDISTSDHLRIDNSDGSEDVSVSFDGSTDHKVVRAGFIYTDDDRLEDAVYLKSASGGVSGYVEGW